MQKKKKPFWNWVKFCTLLSFSTSFALFFFCIRIVDVGVGQLQQQCLGQQWYWPLGGGGNCLVEVGLFESIQVFWEVQEAIACLLIDWVFDGIRSIS